jgi:hypothetical protein
VDEEQFGPALPVMQVIELDRTWVETGRRQGLAQP